MKHPATRAFFDRWSATRGTWAAPTRAAFEDALAQDTRSNAFVLSNDARAGYPIRVLGPRLRMLCGFAANTNFLAQFAPHSRRELASILAAIAEDQVAAVAGIDGVTPDGAAVALELQVLPLRPIGDVVTTMTGTLAAFDEVAGPVSGLTLGNWRYVEPDRRPMRTRMLRKFVAATGFSIYEGLSAQR